MTKKVTQGRGGQKSFLGLVSQPLIITSPYFSLSRNGVHDLGAYIDLVLRNEVPAYTELICNAACLKTCVELHF